MVFITAEIGTTWQGDYDCLNDMVGGCKEMGINAVKFQALSQEKLDKHKELKYYADASVTKRNIPRIAEICNDHKIEFYVTPYYPEAIDFINPWVKRYKISVAGSKDLRLLDKVYSTGKQVIISTTKPMKDIKGNATRIKNLYCVPEYPTSYSSIDFDGIKRFDGYSNHCNNPFAVLQAVEMGASFIEFHITQTKDIFLIDNNVSFNLLEAYDIVRWIRFYEDWNINTGKTNRDPFSEQGPSSTTWKTDSSTRYR